MGLRFAYADPPYLGVAVQFYGPQAAEYDTIEGHARLFDRLAEYDAWACSLSSVTLQTLLPVCPTGVRIGGWFKTFASFKPNNLAAYAWEPVIFWGNHRTKARGFGTTVRDWCAVPITTRRGLTGAKPRDFCRWVFDFMGMRPDDEFVDVFHGSGAVARAHEEWRQQFNFASTNGTSGNPEPALPTARP